MSTDNTRIPSGKRALVIAGAGAALDFGAPSTQELTEILLQKINSDKTMQHFGSDIACKLIHDTLSAYFDCDSQYITFEHIFHCAQQILAITSEPTTGTANEFKPILYPFLRQKEEFMSADALSVLVKRLPDLLFSELSKASDNPTISLTQLASFLELLQTRYITRIYTTNYDDFILQAAPNLYHGFSGSPLDVPLYFDTEDFWASIGKSSLFHLHGSVHFGFRTPANPRDDLNQLYWFKRRSEARLHSSYSGSSRRKMDGGSYYPSALITGFDKLTRIEQKPYAHYYASLAYDAMAADVIFVIGYGLLDIHINERIAEARRRSPCPPIVFIDLWKESFLEETLCRKSLKTIEMFHAFRILIVGDSPYDDAIPLSSGWTIAKSKSCAVWDKGFQAFLGALNELPNILQQLKFVRFPWLK